MASDDVLLARIQKAAAHGETRPSKHARESMSLRGVSAEDVRQALRSATKAIFQSDTNTIRLEGGKDTDGDYLTVVVSEQPFGLRVVTVFDAT
jgi:hypothetical protein